jgi:hypothetical protein
VRNFDLITLVIRLYPLIASIDPNMDVSKPIGIWGELFFQQAVIMIMAAECPTEKHNELVRQGHDRILQRMLFFYHCHARVVWHHLVNDDRCVPWRQ